MTATRVLRYLKGNPSQGLFYLAQSPLQLKAFSDSDWGSCLTSRRSISSYCIFLGDSLISWKCNKQSTISRSSSEAKYRALTNTICEIQWLTYLLHDFVIPFTSPTLLYCDNQSAKYIATNPVFDERNKNIKLDCHIVREKLQEKLFHLLPICSTEQLADILTKLLEPISFNYLLSKLGILNIYSPACEGYWRK
uniref:Copia protein n=1 Tax=Cajanus cajan TaxID=3821 RepID=A0A151R824_CAJCA|nr:Copia protein [Cajanus cajan]